MMNMESHSVGVVILTLNAAQDLPFCIPPLRASSLSPKILVVDSASEDATVAIAKGYGVEVIQIERKEFQHGRTREMARRHLGTDIVLMVTQDAYALDGEVIGHLIRPLVHKQAAAVYARQIPHIGAGFFAAFPREFNYPAVSYERTLQDQGQYGAQTFFFSNSFAAYSNEALDAIGGFPSVTFGEDTLTVARLLHEGYRIAYAAEAVVRHSHAYTLWDEAKRYSVIGRMRAQYQALLQSSSDTQRGTQYAKAMIGKLMKEKLFLKIPYAFLHLGARWLGYQQGKLSTGLQVIFAQLRGLLLLLLLVFFVCSCSSPYHDYEVMGADEFVIDSYRIRQGKLAILELEGKEVGCLSSEDMEEYRDLIAEDDILNIVVYHPTRKDLMESMQFVNQTVGGFRVVQGKVTIPDIPPVYLLGLTLEEAKDRLQEEFRNQIKDIEVFVTYRDRLFRKVELAGMVATPTVPVDGKIRLYEVIARAQIPPNANLFMSYVLRKCKQLPIDLHKLMNEGDMCQNIVMKGGDKVFIASPADSSVVLMGEVRSPRAVSLSYGFISLREALVAAGGIPFTGDRRHIQIIRGNLPCPKIYVLAWEHIIHLPNESLLLMPGDTVYVSETPITQWNRFIEQLLPSFNGVRTAYDTYRIGAQ